MSWEWFVDDVLTATVQNPLLEADAPGSYKIRLRVTDTRGNESSVTHYIQTAGDPDMKLVTFLDDGSVTDVYVDGVDGAMGLDGPLQRPPVP